MRGTPVQLIRLKDFGLTEYTDPRVRAAPMLPLRHHNSDDRRMRSGDDDRVQRK